MSGIYPVGVAVAPGGQVARWRPLVNWLLALPFLLWLVIVSYGAVVVLVVGWFAIVVTGRMPGRLGDYLMGVLRYGWRACAFLFGLTDRYPAFRLVAGYLDPADHPAVFYSAQPLSRRRATVLFRLVLIVPFCGSLLPCCAGHGGPAGGRLVCRAGPGSLAPEAPPRRGGLLSVVVPCRRLRLVDRR